MISWMLPNTCLVTWCAIKWLQLNPPNKGEKKPYKPHNNKKNKNFYASANIWAALCWCTLLENARKSFHCYIKPSKLSILCAKTKSWNCSKAQSKVEQNTRFNLQSNSASGPLDARKKTTKIHLTSSIPLTGTLLSSELSKGEDIMSWNWSLSVYIRTDTTYHKVIDKCIPFMLENKILLCKKKIQT